MIEPRNLYNRGPVNFFAKDNRQFFFDGKADVLILTEGSSPGYAKASVENTTGVEERGMYLQG